MSQRSIIEINHDFAYAVEDRPAVFLARLAEALASGRDEAWEPLKLFGIRRIVQVHHSTDRKVVISGTGWSKEYPIE